jgi:hypothetical protein
MFLRLFYFALEIHRRNFCEPVLIPEDSTWIITNERKNINKLSTEKRKEVPYN